MGIAQKMKISSKKPFHSLWRTMLLSWLYMKEDQTQNGKKKNTVTVSESKTQRKLRALRVEIEE